MKKRLVDYLLLMTNIRMLILFVTLVIRCENIRYNNIFVLVQSSYAFTANKLHTLYTFERLQHYFRTLASFLYSLYNTLFYWNEMTEEVNLISRRRDLDLHHRVEVSQKSKKSYYILQKYAVVLLLRNKSYVRFYLLLFYLHLFTITII